MAWQELNLDQLDFNPFELPDSDFEVDTEVATEEPDVLSGYEEFDPETFGLDLWSLPDVELEEPLRGERFESEGYEDLPVHERLWRTLRNMYAEGAQGVGDIIRTQVAMERKKDPARMITHLEDKGLLDALALSSDEEIIPNELIGASKEEKIKWIEGDYKQYMESAQEFLDNLPEAGKPGFAGMWGAETFEKGAVGMARFAPSMLLAAAGGAGVPGGGMALGVPLSGGVLFTQLYGQKHTELIKKGETEEIAGRTAALHAILATPAESLGNILGIRYVKNVFSKLSGKLLAGLRTRMLNLLAAAGTEGAEEGVQAVTELFSDIMGADDIDDKWKTFGDSVTSDDFWASVWEQFKVGAAGGFLMTGAPTLIATPFDVREWIKQKRVAPAKTEETEQNELFIKSLGKDELASKEMRGAVTEMINALPPEEVALIKDTLSREAPGHPALKLIDDIIKAKPKKEISPEEEVLGISRDARKETVVKRLEKADQEVVREIGRDYGLTDKEMDDRSIDQVIVMVADRVVGITAPAVEGQGGGIDVLETAISAIDKTFKVGTVVEAPTNATRAQVQTLASAMGAQVTFFEKTGKSMLSTVNGFYDGESDRIFISADATNPALRMLGHETWHRLREKHSDLYKNVLAVAKGNEELFTKFAVDINKARARIGLNALKPSVMAEEYFADFAGDMFARASFWKAINKSNPTFAKKIAASLRKIIQDFRRIIAAKPELEKIKQPFENMDQVEAAMSEAFGEAFMREAVPEKAKKRAAPEAKLEIAKKEPGVAKEPWEMTREEYGEYLFGDTKLSKYNNEKWKLHFNKVKPKSGIIKIYRGYFVKERGHLEPGDWVTLDYKFAKENYAGKGGKVLSKEVPIDELYESQTTSSPGKSELIWQREVSAQFQTREGKYESLKEHHKNYVKQALSEGKPVPEEVLKDYPEITAAKKPVPAKKEPTEVKYEGQIQEFKETEFKDSDEIMSFIEDRFHGKVGVVEGKEPKVSFSMKTLPEITETENSKKMIKAAMKVMGTTNDLMEAGYILPSGKLLDFSGKKEGGTPGMRSLDHREIGKIDDPEEGGDKTIKDLQGGTVGMLQFISATGAIRFAMYGKPGNKTIAIEVMNKLTDTQKQIVGKAVKESGGDISIDVFGEWTESSQYVDPLWSQSFETARPSEVIKFIESGEAKPKEVSFSLRASQKKKLSPIAQEYLDMLMSVEPGDRVVSKKDIETDPFEGLSEEIRERLGAARGIPVPSFIKKFREAVKTGVYMFTRSRPFIDPKEMANIDNVLRIHQEVPENSKRRATQIIEKIIGGLKPRQYDVFSMAIIMNDMVRDLESGLLSDEEGLPFGFKSQKQAVDYQKRIQKLADSDSMVKDALRRRNLFQEKLKKVLVNHGLLSETVLEDPRYFHHQVLEYRATEKIGLGVSAKDVRLHKKGWQRARTGSIKEYNTEYAESEYEIISQAITQLETKASLNRIKAMADITGSLKILAEQKGLEGNEWHQLIPDGYVRWRPEPNSAWYRAYSLTDRTIMAVQSGDIVIGSENLDKNLKEIIAKGRVVEWVVPEGLAKTLDDFGNFPMEHWLSQGSHFLQSKWKQWILMNPFRIVKYNLNNMSGDLDIAIAYDPKILIYFKNALKDTWKDWRKKTITKDLKKEIDETYRLGVLGSGWSVQEVSGIAPHLSYNKLVEALDGSKPNILQKFWRTSTGFTAFRENILRLAAFRYFKDLVVKKGEINIYGASNRDKIDGIEDPTERAAALARDLVGDYGNISDAGQWIRRHMIPFYSWLEINAPRYVRLMRNLSHEGKSRKFVAASVAWKGTKLGMKATALFVLVNLWNHIFFPDEEAELGEAHRRQQHIILGRRKDGTIISLRFQGALSDAMAWFGGEDFAHDVMDVTKGKVPISEKIIEALKAPLIKIISGIRPDIKTPAEIIGGRSWWPDPFNPRPIRDKWEHVARLFSLNSLYRAAAGKPRRGDTLAKRMLNDLMALGFYTSDPGESAFWDVKKWTYDFLEKEGRERPGVTPSSRSNAMYYYKQALRYGDLRAAKKYLDKYVELGGTKKGKTQSIRMSGPVGNIPKKFQRKFRQTLNPKQQEILELAEHWYESVYKGPKSKAIPWPKPKRKIMGKNPQKMIDVLNLRKAKKKDNG